MDIFEVIEERRSIRKFLPKPVEEEKVLKILNSAIWAPSAGNLQDWEFIIVKDKTKIFQLAEAAYGQYWISTAPLVIVVCTKLKKMAGIYGERGVTLYSVQDAAMAAQNILLTAHALGLGSCFVSSFDEEIVKRLLNIPENVKVHALIPIGYPAEKPRPPHRLPLDSFVYFEEYGNKLKQKRERIVWE